MPVDEKWKRHFSALKRFFPFFVFSNSFNFHNQCSSNFSLSHFPVWRSSKKKNYFLRFQCKNRVRKIISTIANLSLISSFFLCFVRKDKRVSFDVNRLFPSSLLFCQFFSLCLCLETMRVDEKQQTSKCTLQFIALMKRNLEKELSENEMRAKRGWEK